MTLFDFEELAKYWADHPPLHILVAAYLGAGKQRCRPTGPSLDDSRSTGSTNPEELAELGTGFRAGDVHAGMTPVVLDFAELRRQTASSWRGHPWSSLN
jgi:hypothetical protein